MSKKIISYALMLVMAFSVIAMPAQTFATTESVSAGAAYSNGTATASEVKVATPKKLKAKAYTSTTMNLSWNKVSGATGYIVYRWDRTARKYYPIKKTTKTSFKDKKLKPNVFYYYRVTAYVKKDGVTYESERTPYAKARTEKNDRDKIIAKARTKLNAQYRFGASGPNRFDCSGFVYWVYKYADISPKKKVKRSSCAGMYNSLKKYKVGSSLSYLNKKGKAGDIVFFKRYGRISHVGIYYKDGKMIHAANPRKDILIQKISNFQRGGAKVCAVVRLV